MANRPIAALSAEVAAVLQTAGVTTATYNGLRFLGRNHAPPRYVWVATSDTFDGEDKRLPENALTSKEVVAIHCWGEDADEAYRMRNNVIVALLRMCGSAVTFLQSGWLKDKEDSDVQKGSVYQLNTTIEVAIPDRIIADDTSTNPQPDVEILGAEETVTMVFPSGEETTGN